MTFIVLDTRRCPLTPRSVCLGVPLATCALPKGVRYLLTYLPLASLEPAATDGRGLVGLDGFEVRLCDPCDHVRPCVPCVSRLPPVSFYRYRYGISCGLAVFVVEETKSE